MKKINNGSTKWLNQNCYCSQNSLFTFIKFIHLLYSFGQKKIIFRAWRKFILIIKVLLMAAESQKLSHSKKIKQRGRKLANICAKLVWRLYTTSCVLCLILLLVVYILCILQFLLSFAAFSLFINKKGQNADVGQRGLGLIRRLCGLGSKASTYWSRWQAFA